MDREDGKLIIPEEKNEYKHPELIVYKNSIPH